MARADTPDLIREFIVRMPEPARTGMRPASRPDNRRVLSELYGRRSSAPLWSNAGAATEQARSVIATLRSASEYGLRSDQYGGEGLAAQLVALSGGRNITLEEWMQFDVALSNSAVNLVHDLHYGQVDPRAVGFDMPPRNETFDSVEQLEQLATHADTTAVLAAVQPDFLHYRLLLQSLVRYRQLASRTDLTALPPVTGPQAVGQSYVGAPALRHLLVALGDLPPENASRTDAILDSDLGAALKRFQYLHGLREDGTLGGATFAALTVPLAQRLRQIELTLERWRWLPPPQAPTIIVNIPQFRLFLFRSKVDREADMLRMNVIVGQEYPRLRTPVFAANMNAVVFRPYWDVPSSITRRELLPLMRKRPDYLETQHMEIVGEASDGSPPLTATAENLQALNAGRLRLRQRPGAGNSLGLIKFVLPNSYGVYLHSTPAQLLFAEPRRSFSHGCIRVSDPVALAAEVLSSTPGDWTVERIQAAMKGDVTLRVGLTEPVHVLILYGTAVTSEDGALHFFDDIYGHDRRLEAALGLMPISPRPADRSP